MGHVFTIQVSTQYSAEFGPLLWRQEVVRNVLALQHVRRSNFFNISSSGKSKVDPFRTRDLINEGAGNVEI